VASEAVPCRNDIVVELAAPITLDTVAPDDERALRDWFAVLTAAQAHDVPTDPPPCWVEHGARLVATDPGYTETAWLARAGTGEAVGVAVLALPTLDNPEVALAELVVVPRHRRRGVGRMLLHRLGDAARAAGRARLITEAREPLDEPGPAPAFLAAAGGRKALADQRRRLTLPPPDPAHLEALGAEARAAAAGYDLVQWTGDTPPEWLDDMAALKARMSTDPPLDDLNYGPERYDADRIRALDAARAARGVRRTVTAARSPGGRLVAYTDIFQTTSVAWHAQQGDTLVAPTHRGRRLGMLVKLANLECVLQQSPEIRVIDTYNADSNPWMVSINEAMGYGPYDRLGQWEIEL
jgi:GNAT superfamily N-acetyltransferase